MRKTFSIGLFPSRYAYVMTNNMKQLFLIMLAFICISISAKTKESGEKVNYHCNSNVSHVDGNPNHSNVCIPNQAEVVTEGLKALKLNDLQALTQSSVPTAHNPNLDTTFRKYASNTEEKNEINQFLNKTYQEKGIFLGSALIQHEIDRQQLAILLEANTDILITNNINPELGKRIKSFGSDFYKSIKPNSEKLFSWMDNDYTPFIQSNLHYNKKPDYQEVLDMLDSIAIKKSHFNLDEKMTYYSYLRVFKHNRTQNRKDSQAMSDLIAYKMFLIDVIIMKRNLKRTGVFGKNSFFIGQEELSDFYDKWMSSISPKGKDLLIL